MWIAQKNGWNSSHTDLSKYFIERVKQKVDFEEIISNRHRTSNGYTLIEEICEVSQLALKRIKSINRLLSLLNESKSENIKASIINDFILNKYHGDIVLYYKNVNHNKIKESAKDLTDLHNKSRINSKRLEIEYLNNIISEINLIDFQSTNFERYAKKIDLIIDCLIPYLIFKGYSTTSISDISFRFIDKANGNKSALRIVSKFKSQLSNYTFLIKTKEKSIEIQTISDYLNNKSVPFNIVKYTDIKTNYLFPRLKGDKDVFFKIERSTIDPHNYLRNLYEICLKKYVISRDRMDLTPLNDFFERVFWKFTDAPKHNFQKSNFNIDPLNVSKRKSSLLETLQSLSKSFDYDFNDKTDIPYIEDISDSLYYYNLALGSKSIENSLSLLWTSLETLLPYRMQDNDIMNVQHFVSKSLSVGTIGREITSFALRYSNCNWLNGKCFDPIGIHTNYLNYTSDGLKIYLYWLCTTFNASNDPFNLIKENSNLLCNDFCNLNDKYTGKNNIKVQYWIDKINSSEELIKFQLDRIYLHRNQIVHSGKFINEYSNLWNHLEWYIGKLLSYCVFRYIKCENKEAFSKVEIFYELEAYCDNIKNQLKVNSNKKINEIEHLYDEILKQSWQFS
ncbi:hypothetical protein [Flavobacterium reichenbachii]|uniref:Apea-like HEPN domain-containing protein n=1 Tax=Flavobacterium reichenbachii TaxID=362418 RepID=A0A085ZNT8_9FLAO|nr:hypothetical protein [Flavobacterium reichenbachii]KFF06102.1 hypothetical protein IW19_11435 [Flavobacterium reichenbachii]OXB14674.1 hypothetical protein B0A68_11510 [Flavobacterium reichenbachii]